MKSLVAILLIFSLLFPSAGWAKAWSGQPCDRDGVMVSCAAQSHCPCCEPASCACMSSEDRSPSTPPAPLPPTRTGVLDLLGVPPVVDFSLGGLIRLTTASKCLITYGLKAAAAPSVPLFIRHCSPLW